MKLLNGRFARRRARLLRSLPPLEEILGGSLFERRRRCGNPSCHCAKEDGHPTVYLGVRLPSGRIEQLSLISERVPLAKKWAANYKRLLKIIDEISSINRQWFRKEQKISKRSSRRR